MTFSSDHICCYEIPNAEDIRVREGDRKHSGGGGTVFIRCLPIVLSTTIHRGYIVNTAGYPPRFPISEILPEILVPRP